MQKSDRRFLFCATEPGGARELCPIAAVAVQRGISCRILCSPVTAPIFADAGLPTEQRAISSCREAERELQENAIDMLIIGTTGKINSERHLTAAAKKRQIRSIAVLDEWYNYALRFWDENEHIHDAYLPDVICAQDELSRDLAIQEGIPSAILHITGSPALAELTTRAHTFTLHPPDAPDVLKAGKQCHSILSLSEPLRATYGAAPGERGTMGPYLGYQEDIARTDLAEILSSMHGDFFVIEKLHPLEGVKPPPAVNDNVTWHMAMGSFALWPLLWHVDLIIGMHTKALLEAAILGRRPISYQPHAYAPERCTAVRLKVAELSVSREHLAGLLHEHLEKRTSDRQECLAFSFAHPGAAEKVLDLAG